MSETMAKPTLGQPTVVFQVTMRPFEATVFKSIHRLVGMHTCTDCFCRILMTLRILTHILHNIMRDFSGNRGIWLFTSTWYQVRSEAENNSIDDVDAMRD
jgi:hypothetical protein